LARIMLLNTATQGALLIKDDEMAKVMVLSADGMKRSRIVDHIAIILALGTVFLLWSLQWMGLYLPGKETDKCIIQY